MLHSVPLTCTEVIRLGFGSHKTHLIINQFA